MKDFVKYILFLFISILNKKHRFIILSPNLTNLKFYKTIIFDKRNKTFFTYYIRNKYDYITVIEIYFYQSYTIKNFKFYNKAFIELIKKKLLIIDCGSNIGCSTNFFLNDYENSKIISIEPDMNNFEMLVKNVKNNERVKLINTAISNEVINFEVQGDPTNLEDSRGKNIVDVLDNNLPKSIKINDILSQKENKDYFPYLIKIDIEGYENNLFESNTEWVDQFKIIIIELHDWMLPGKSSSKNFFKVIAESMKKHNRDMVIKGENLISIKYK